MRTTALIGMIAFAFPAGATAHFLPHRKHLSLEQRVAYFQRSVRHDRLQVHRDQRALRFLAGHRHRVFGAESLPRLFTVRARWHRHALRWHTDLLRRAVRARERALQRLMSPVGAISYWFGPHASEALRVAACESGLSVWAQNGQYLGLFQMGDYARARYGHSSTAWGQARAAAAYFHDAGWGPWECSPW